MKMMFRIRCVSAALSAAVLLLFLCAAPARADDEEERSGPAPQLSLSLSSDRDAYNGEDTIFYTIRVKEETEDASAEEVKVTACFVPGIEPVPGRISCSPAGIRTEELPPSDPDQAEGSEDPAGWEENCGRRILLTISRLSYVDGETVITIPALIDPLRFDQAEALCLVTASCREQPQEAVAMIKPSVRWRIWTGAEHGSITQDVSAASGSNVRVAYEAEEGYYLYSLKEDGENVPLTGAENEYLFRDVRANHFLKAEYRRTPKLGLVIVPDRENCRAESGAPMTIRVTQTERNAAAEDLEIFYEAPPGCGIDPDSLVLSRGTAETEADEQDGVRGLRSFTVREERLGYGEELMITFTLSAGRELKDSLIVNRVTADCRGTVRPAEAEAEVRFCYAIKTAVKNGSITGSFEEIGPGETFEVSYRPFAGYYLSGIRIDGRYTDFTRCPDEYVFEKIRSDHEITVYYTKNPVSVRPARTPERPA